MAELDPVDRLLSVTRENFRAAPESRERVRSELAARGLFDAGPSGRGAALTRGLFHAGNAGLSRSAVALLSAATFVAGFWLRGEVAQREPSAPLPAVPSAVGGAASFAGGGALAAETPASRAADGAVAASSSGSSSATADAAPLPEGTAPGVREPRAPVGHGKERGRAPSRDAQVSRAQVSRAQEHGHSAGEELSLLRRAEHSIRSGEPDLALEFLDDLERRYPDTRLGEERAAARLMARCARGDASARGDAARFLDRQPASVYSERVRALCTLDKPAPARDGTAGTGH